MADTPGPGSLRTGAYSCGEDSHPIPEPLRTHISEIAALINQIRTESPKDCVDIAGEMLRLWPGFLAVYLAVAGAAVASMNATWSSLFTAKADSVGEGRAFLTVSLLLGTPWLLLMQDAAVRCVKKFATGCGSGLEARRTIEIPEIPLTQSGEIACDTVVHIKKELQDMVGRRYEYGACMSLLRKMVEMKRWSLLILLAFAGLPAAFIDGRHDQMITGKIEELGQGRAFVYFGILLGFPLALIAMDATAFCINRFISGANGP